MKNRAATSERIQFITGISSRVTTRAIYTPITKVLSISPIFYEQLFRMKVFSTALMCLQFGFVIFWQKDFCAKAADKMVVKLTDSEMGKLKTSTLASRMGG